MPTFEREILTVPDTYSVIGIVADQCLYGGSNSFSFNSTGILFSKKSPKRVAQGIVSLCLVRSARRCLAVSDLKQESYGIGGYYVEGLISSLVS